MWFMVVKKKLFDYVRTASQEELCFLGWPGWFETWFYYFKLQLALRHARDGIYCSSYTGDVQVLQRSPGQNLWMSVEVLWGKSSNLPISVCPLDPTLTVLFTRHLCLCAFSAMISHAGLSLKWKDTQRQPCPCPRGWAVKRQRPSSKARKHHIALRSKVWQGKKQPQQPGWAQLSSPHPPCWTTYLTAKDRQNSFMRTSKHRVERVQGKQVGGECVLMPFTMTLASVSASPQQEC